MRQEMFGVLGQHEKISVRAVTIYSTAFRSSMTIPPTVPVQELGYTLDRSLRRDRAGLAVDPRAKEK